MRKRKEAGSQAGLPQTHRESHQTRRQLLLLGALFLGSVWILFQVDLNQSYRLVLPPPVYLEEKIREGFVVKTRGCSIPRLEVSDGEVRRLSEKAEPVDCERGKGGRGPPLVLSNLTSLRIDPRALAHYNLSRISQVSCCYRPFFRVTAPPEDDSSKVDRRHRYSSTCHPLGEAGATPEEDFVRVECALPGRPGPTDYTDFFAFVHAGRGRGKWEERGEGRPASVLIVGVDSVSRLNLHRTMPTTVKVLKELGAVELLGYNKVADNTFPNLVPVLTGLTEEELKAACWPDASSVFDPCPLVWKEFSARGYTTGFGEDAAWMGVFNYMKVGFRTRPTDFYLQTFNLVAEEEIGHEKRLNAYLCTGARLSADLLLDVVLKYAVATKERPSFGMFWGSSLSHDFLELPRRGDASHASLLRSLRRRGILEDTVLVFMSDHGIRWGKIRETYRGYLEERLPFLFLRLPPRWKRSHPKAAAALRDNARKLTTPFDLHETLLDLADPGRLRGGEGAPGRGSGSGRGRSLFSGISEDRTCAEANISGHWCACQASTPLPLDSSVVAECAAAVLRELERLLRAAPQCRPLSLARVLSARVALPASSSSPPSPWRDYTLSLETRPGGAKFEATLRLASSTGVPPHASSPPAPATPLLLGTVSRLNSYGDTSSCVSDYRLKLYCYCLPDS